MLKLRTKEKEPWWQTDGCSKSSGNIHPASVNKSKVQLLHGEMGYEVLHCTRESTIGADELVPEVEMHLQHQDIQLSVFYRD